MGRIWDGKEREFEKGRRRLVIRERNRLLGGMGHWQQVGSEPDLLQILYIPHTGVSVLKSGVSPDL